ncbi:MAG TPA: SusC/RagA family TonB-linked outer membrane protein, partial [Paludibacter sp.]|nr:SusC/RagA family TonB-linked outer membrane protein [Paludibacter sp.]
MNEKSKFQSNVLRKLKLLAIFCSLSIVMMAQTMTVSGKVTSAESGESLMGVTVIVKGSDKGTVTDMDGKYSISIPNKDAVLVFSFIGMNKLETKTGNSSVFNVALTSNTQLMSEVVVTGYSTQKKADLTGAVTVVDVNELKKAAYNNPIQSLQGRAAGVDITSDGSPSGSGTTVRIRGIGTLNNNDPLYVIDGVPTKSGMHELNQADIESIQVLRDASAASIYGSRSGNGVIIITTKKGKSGKAKVNFDTYLSTSQYGKVIDMLNTKQFGQVQWQAMMNSGVDPNTNQIGYMYDYNYDTNGNPVLNGIKVPKYIDARDGTNTMLSANTDWFGELTRPGIAQSYNLSVSSGTDKSTSFLSLGYYNNQGTIKDTYFNRFSARMNNSYKLLGDLITVGENFTINNTGELQAPGGVLELSILSLPIMPVKKTNGDWGSVTSGMRDRDNPARILDANKDNPYSYWRTFGNAYIDIQPIKNFHVKSSFGIDYGNYYQRALTYSFTGRLGSDLTSAKLIQSHSMKWSWTNTATYDFKVGKNQFNLLAGTEFINQKDINFSTERRTYEL